MLIVNLLKQSTLAIVAKLLSLSCVIVERKYDFNNFNLEKLCSADATVTGIVNKILYAIAALAKQSCPFRNLRISRGPFLLE